MNALPRSDRMYANSSSSDIEFIDQSVLIIKNSPCNTKYMTNPAVSILIPTYEPNKNHLIAALDSILAQTEQRFLVLIHDDASEINVEGMVKPYLNDPRFRFVRSEKRRGIGGNWNECLQVMAKGQGPRANVSYVQFLFQDDLWHPTYLEQSLEIMGNDSSIGFTAAHHRYETDGGMELPEGYRELEDIRSDVGAYGHTPLQDGKHNGKEFLKQWAKSGLCPNLIGEPSFVMMRRFLVEDTGFFREDMQQGLDVEYWIRLLPKTNWYFIQESLGTFRVHADSASTRHEAAGIGLFDRLRCLERLLQELPPSEKSEVRHQIASHIGQMVQKFFHRRSSGKKTSGDGWRWFLGFCMRHPLVMLLALRRYNVHDSHLLKTEKI